MLKLGKQDAIGIGMKLDDEQVMAAVDRVIQFYGENAKRGERLGKMIERIGLAPFKEAI